MRTLPKTWKGWIDIGSDINWEDYGGLWAKRDPAISFGRWFVLRVENISTLDMIGKHGAEKLGYSYEAEVSLVDINVVDPAVLASLATQCDWLDLNIPICELAWIFELVINGVHASLCVQTSKTHPHKLRRLTKDTAETLMQNPADVADLLDVPCNAFGTTKREAMVGKLLKGADNENP